MKKILIVIGTRPEAIKMAPVYKALVQETSFVVETLSSGQHSDLLDQVFDAFNWRPDHTLQIARESLTELYGQLFVMLGDAFTAIRPDMVLVHGDTATTAIASQVAFLQRIPLAHVEAGLRSGRRQEPWPEEVNRRLTSLVADFHFAPTALAKMNLLREGVAESSVTVTGNTAVDAVLSMSSRLDMDSALSQLLEQEFAFLDKRRPLVLLTGHRRENFGDNHARVFAAMHWLTEHCNCEIVFPVHPNPQLGQAMDLVFRNSPHIHLLHPVSYPTFVYLMKRCAFIVSDSGGIQEEAPTFGKNVLVTRNVTERPEGIEAGFLQLVGCDEAAIITSAKKILGAPAMSSAANPYGDGQASERIRRVLCVWAGRNEATEEVPPSPALPLQDEKTLCVIGLGYVGLPTALMFAKAGYQVRGYDKSSALVAELNDGQTDMNEVGILELLRERLFAGMFKAYSEISQADAYFICVPTPVTETSHEPDLMAVFSAVDAIKQVLKPGDLVVLESTSPVGTTRLAYTKLMTHLRKIYPSASFHMAYCPERILPGNVLEELQKLDRVIGGIDSTSASMAHHYFSKLTKGTCYETDAPTAEFVKLAENAFRDVNIAFANELKNLCQLQGVDVEEVRGFANMHPRVDILQPGIGVGGHCIPVDPWLLVNDSLKGDASVIRSARAVNDRQPILVARLVMAAIREHSATKLAVFGLTYKANVNDFRESPAMEVLKYLSLHSTVEMDLYDPFLKPHEALSAFRGAKQKHLVEFVPSQLHVFLVAHDAFAPLVQRVATGGYPMLDFCNLSGTTSGCSVARVHVF